MALDLGAVGSVSVSASYLDEVLMNLIFNAVDAMPKSGIITIRSWDDENWGCVSVSDTGVGMDRETLSRIGELFFTTKTNGHGIGLATCYHLVGQMSGQFSVESSPGKGTTFTLKVPAQDER